VDLNFFGRFFFFFLFFSPQDFFSLQANSWQPATVVELHFPAIAKAWSSRSSSAPDDAPHSSSKSSKKAADNADAAAETGGDAGGNDDDGDDEPVVVSKKRPAVSDAAAAPQKRGPGRPKKTSGTTVAAAAAAGAAGGATTAASAKDKDTPQIGFAHGHDLKEIVRVKMSDAGLIALVRYKSGSSKLPAGFANEQFSIETKKLIDHSWEASKLLNEFYERRVTAPRPQQ
jgi:hypothetical protein